MRNTLLSYLSIISAPAFAATNGHELLAQYGYGVMILAGFALLLALALLPLWLYKSNGSNHRNV